MNDEINLGTMTLESSPKNGSKAHDFYKLNNSVIQVRKCHSYKN